MKPGPHSKAFNLHSPPTPKHRLSPANLTQSSHHCHMVMLKSIRIGSPAGDGKSAAQGRAGQSNMSHAGIPNTKIMCPQPTLAKPLYTILPQARGGQHTYLHLQSRRRARKAMNAISSKHFRLFRHTTIGQSGEEKKGSNKIVEPGEGDSSACKEPILQA